MASKQRERIQWIGMLAAPLAALLVYLALPAEYAAPDGEAVPFTHAGRTTAAVAVWMAIWWLTEAIPLYATALLPLALLPALGATTMKAAAAPYGHELIFLFMGGFILALAMERWGIHRRVAFFAIRLVGSRPDAIVGGFMLATAVLSMWVSNTATSIMMLPVALSVAGRAEGGASDEETHHFQVTLLLGIAYGASIGGIATLIGTPPNLFMASYAADNLGREIGFAQWMSVGLPLVALFLPIAWWLLTRVLHPVPRRAIAGTAEVAREGYEALGPLGRGERVTAVVFFATAALWIGRPFLKGVEWGGVQPFAGLTDAGIAIAAAIALFAIPIEPRERVFAMDWPTAVKLPWGLLVLFGGGLSLAAAIRANGVGELLGSQMAALAGAPPVLIVVVLVALMIFLTELTSNTATTATLLPILAGLAPGLGLDPFTLIVPATIAASCAFMLPVATPPNAVVFGSGLIELPQMSRAGLWLNLVGIALIPALTFWIALPLLGVGK